MKLFKLPLYFWSNVFREIREIPQWVNASLFLELWAFFCKNHDIFMAAICDMALGRLADWRYFLAIVHDWIKTRFIRKEASSYIQIVIIVWCLLQTSFKHRKDNQYLACYQGCLLSVYHDIVTFSQQKLKNCLCFISLVANHISPYF